MPDVKIIADLLENEQTRVALLEDGKLTEIFIDYNFDEENNNFMSSRAKSSRLARQGDIFIARIDTLLPAINAAFASLVRPSKSHNEPRNAFLYLNEAPENVKPGDYLIVQVVKNARKNKAPRISARVSIPGRWLVLVPDSDETGVSRRIFDNSERKRLKHIADSLKSQVPGLGVIIRTAAEGVDEKFLQQDLDSLLNLWHEIENKAKNNPAPCLLYRDTGTLGRVLRDEISGTIDEIIINDPEEFENVKNFVERFYPERPNLQLYTGITPIFEYFGIESEIDRALERKVWLKSGAYLVIDQTEALTVIDVNSGKFTDSPDMRHTVLSVNLEAASEIARQLRLRSLGGIVVVDFIDMDFDEDREKLLKHFDSCIMHDRLKARVFSITKLGLVELTRKRERPDLRSVLTRNCPLCCDNGFVEREESLAMKIKRFIRKITSANKSEAFLIHTSTHMANYLKNYIPDWEKEFDRKIFIAGISNFDWDKYKLDYQGDLQSTLSRAKMY
ncbi:MAG: Rne/Rng family ribonuclease [Synergistaceae bacterium]|nr:Rne/Rng family ribonuclease [Synergistaceae bacterium]